MGTGALRVTNGGKRYSRDGGHAAPVFESIDLDIEAGEIFVLLGPSGCGKSTLLRVLAGLEPLSEGRVEVCGPGLIGGGNGVGPVGIAFQEPRLLPWLTVAENVALGLRFGANRAARVPGAVEQALEDFGLAAEASSYPGELSGGQAQRASLARSVVIRPSILLLDEPFSALDPRTRGALQDWLLQVVRRRGLTTVLVTHDVEEALYLGDRIALMSSRPGRIVQTWDTGHRATDGEQVGVDGAAGVRESRERRRAEERLLEARREILARYQTDVPTASAQASQASWVI